jgi:hypothetical protein
MQRIPNIIKESGLQDIGLLSMLYLSRPNDDFFAGIFQSEKKLFLVVKVKDEIFLKLPVTEKEIEMIFRGELSLSYMLKRFEGPIFLSPPEKNIKTPSRIKLLISTLLLETSNRIYMIPNAYYYWNEFYYERQLLK